METYKICVPCFARMKTEVEQLGFSYHGICSWCGRSTTVWDCRGRASTNTTTNSITITHNFTEGRSDMNISANITTSIVTVEAVGGYRGQIKINHNLFDADGKEPLKPQGVVWESEVFPTSEEAAQAALTAYATVSAPKAKAR